MEEMERVHGRIDYGVNRQVIIAYRDTLWMPEIQRPSSIANVHMDRVIAGDIYTSARMFSNLYAVGCESVPISRLTFLAANLVLLGGMENPSGVAGLEVAVIPAGGAPIFLSKEKEEELTSMAERFSGQLRTLLLQEVDYRPSPPPVRELP
jgi:hypothetical protein